MNEEFNEMKKFENASSEMAIKSARQIFLIAFKASYDKIGKEKTKEAITNIQLMMNWHNKVLYSTLRPNVPTIDTMLFYWHQCRAR